MAKASIIKKFTISANGVLYTNEDDISIEIEETGELKPLKEILSDFDGKAVKITAVYDEDY